MFPLILHICETLETSMKKIKTPNILCMFERNRLEGKLEQTEKLFSIIQENYKRAKNEQIEL
jgi:hypothetical protein